MRLQEIGGFVIQIFRWGLLRRGKLILAYHGRPADPVMRGRRMSITVIFLEQSNVGTR
jgi:hypothetical protein